jgi:hypothetical protein
MELHHKHTDIVVMIDVVIDLHILSSSECEEVFIGMLSVCTSICMDMSLAST